VVTGRETRPIIRAVEAGHLDVDRLVDLTARPADEVVAELEGSLRDRIVYGVGNLHGGGIAITRALEALAVAPRPVSPAIPLEERGVA
jgi:gamma-polyglutamate synthase